MKISGMTFGYDLQQEAQIKTERSHEQDFQQLLDNVVNTKDKEKLYQSCQELESVFWYKILENMQASIPRSSLINRGFATETFESMLYEEYAKIMSQTGSNGLADIIFRQLSLSLENNK